jgi:hypothetical protein
MKEFQKKLIPTQHPSASDIQGLMQKVHPKLKSNLSKSSPQEDSTRDQIQDES